MNTTLKCCIHGLGATFFDDEISLVLLIQEVKDINLKAGFEFNSQLVIKDRYLLYKPSDQLLIVFNQLTSLLFKELSHFFNTLSLALALSILHLGILL